MSAWASAAGLLLAYNAVARWRGRPYACAYIRALPPTSKALAAAGYLALGRHLFLVKGKP